MTDNNTDNKVEQKNIIGNIHTKGSVKIGDINKTEIYNFTQEPQFVKLESLQEYESPYFPNSPQANSKIDNLSKQKLLVLAGNHEDKSDLALHLAVKLRKEKLTDESIFIWEWQGSSNPKKLVAAIRGEGYEKFKKNQHNIIILPDIQPQYNLNQIEQAAGRGNNYVIATTDVPIAKWTVANKLVIWDTSTDPPIYQSKDLAEALIQKLNDKKISLNDDLKLSIQESVGDYLKKIAEVEYCLQLLLTKKEISKITIHEAVCGARKNRKNSLKQWFNSSALTDKEKLLVLGLSFFDGLFEDQFFAALEIVVRDVWQQRDPTLMALDYQDLENLGNYYELSERTDDEMNSNGFKVINTENYPTKPAIGKIKIRNYNDRPQLLEVAWKTHRRQIMNALGAIVNIVKESVEQQPGNWELYGTLFRRNLLHNTVSQTLCDIGLGETSAAIDVRTPLLELASHETFEVKDVAAQAIAQWYIYGSIQEQSLSRQRFFGTLTNFWSIATQKQIWSIATQKQKDASETEERQENIGAAVARTISYAAINTSSSEEFKQDFLNWLEEISRHPSQIVREHFGYHTLFNIVPVYLDELKESLKEWTQKYEELNHPIAVALARAYKEHPSSVKDILDKWRNEARQNLSDIKNERLLTTVALTYGEIEYDNWRN